MGSWWHVSLVRGYEIEQMSLDWGYVSAEGQALVCERARAQLKIYNHNKDEW